TTAYAAQVSTSAFPCLHRGGCSITIAPPLPPAPPKPSGGGLLSRLGGLPCALQLCVEDAQAAEPEFAGGAGYGFGPASSEFNAMSSRGMTSGWAGAARFGTAGVRYTCLPCE